MMMRFDLSTSMDTGHDGDDPAHPLERYGEAAQEGEGEMKGTPRAPWTPEQDKKLRALVLSANSVDTIAEALNRTTFAVRRRANTLRLPLRKIARHRRLI
jgi:hypothetical protein